MSLHKETDEPPRGKVTPFRRLVDVRQLPQLTHHTSSIPDMPQVSEVLGTASLDELRWRLYTNLPKFLLRQSILHECLFCIPAF